MPEYNFDLFMQGFAKPHEYTNPLVKKKRRPLSATVPSHNSMATETMQSQLLKKNYN
jgi:hypothetical protein